MKVVVAIDSFKGCLSSMEANRAAAVGVRQACPTAEVVEVAVSDGGEGFVDAVRSSHVGELVEVTACDPLLRPIKARYLLRGSMAVMEVAQVCGLMLLSPDERNPVVATSYGVGQLVADAVRRGATHVVVGLGGSGTSDAGVGMLTALTNAFTKDGTSPEPDTFTATSDFSENDLPSTLCSWPDIPTLRPVRFTIATDVTNPLCGEHGAARVFAPQKGATTEQVILLEERTQRFAEIAARRMGFDRSQCAGAGAAGGLGYAFMQFLGVECRPGAELLLDTIGFDAIVSDADIVITGEGSADRQTLMGKLPLHILRHAATMPVCLIAGRVSDAELLVQAGFAHVQSINPPDLTLETALRKDVAQRNIAQSVEHLLTRCT